MSGQRVTPSKLGRASIRSIWARTLVAVSKGSQQIWYNRKLDGSRGAYNRKIGGRFERDQRKHEERDDGDTRLDCTL